MKSQPSKLLHFLRNLDVSGLLYPEKWFEQRVIPNKNLTKFLQFCQDQENKQSAENVACRAF